ncbi:MAG: T9SS type A sorting domain-containing protein, partial [Hymenobacter sp.]
TAEPQGADALLKWTTASEKNNDHFDVEASADGRTFQRIGQVAGHGTTTQAHDYQLVDPAIAHYAASPVYYRLRQVDLNGTATYSPVRAVAVGQSALALFPNPTTGATTLLGAAPRAAVTVFDALGRLVLSATADAVGTAPLALPEGLAVGVYLVRTGTTALRLTVE